MLQRWNKEPGQNPWEQGTLAPIRQEVFKEHLEVVEGSVPKELDGVYIRTGANHAHDPFGGQHWCVLHVFVQRRHHADCQS
jgi:carotenoid cleavage dioxygenase-like enzyme